MSEEEFFNQLVEHVTTPEGEARIAALLKQQKKIQKMRRALSKEVADFNKRMAR